TSRNRDLFRCKIRAGVIRVKRPVLILSSTVVVWLAIGTVATVGTNAQNAPNPAQGRAAPAKPAPVAAHPATATPDFDAVVKRYCATCHTEARKPGGLSLASYDVAKAADHAEITEAMIRKLRAGMMPP